MIFIFSAEILGEISDFYGRFQHWDTVLHTLNGFLCAAIGFALVDILNENKQIKFELSPAFCVIVAMCFSMTIGVLWEFFEFGADHLLGLDMQKDTVLTQFQSVSLDPSQSNTPVLIEDIVRTTIETADGSTYVIDGYLDVGLADTTQDLFVNFIGATVFCIIGWLYVYRRGKNRLAAAFIPIVRPAEPVAEESSS